MFNSISSILSLLPYIDLVFTSTICLNKISAHNTIDTNITYIFHN